MRSEQLHGRTPKSLSIQQGSDMTQYFANLYAHKTSSHQFIFSECIFQFLRYKREEIKIQAWESQQRAKLEAEMQRIEVSEIPFLIIL